MVNLYVPRTISIGHDMRKAFVDLRSPMPFNTFAKNAIWEKITEEQRRADQFKKEVKV